MGTIPALPLPFGPLDTLDRSPFGHKNPIYVFKNRRPETGRLSAPNHRHQTVFNSGSFFHSRASTRHRPRFIKLVEADGIEPTTSSLQS